MPVFEYTSIVYESDITTSYTFQTPRFTSTFIETSVSYTSTSTFLDSASIATSTEVYLQEFVLRDQSSNYILDGSTNDVEPIKGVPIYTTADSANASTYRIDYGNDNYLYNAQSGYIVCLLSNAETGTAANKLDLKVTLSVCADDLGGTPVACDILLTEGQQYQLTHAAAGVRAAWLESHGRLFEAAVGYTGNDTVFDLYAGSTNC